MISWRSCVPWWSRSSSESAWDRRVAPTSSVSTTSTRSPTASSTFTAPYSERVCKSAVGESVFARLKELLRHSAIYGLGSIVSRVLAVLLLPLYTRYLSPTDYGLIETLIALSAVLTALVAQGMKRGFFRFYFDPAEPARRLLVIPTAFWYVVAASPAGGGAGIAVRLPLSL